MNGVIVEYRGQRKIRIVESATERRAREYHNAKINNEAMMGIVLSKTIGSVKRESMHKPWYHCGTYTDTKCWKNQHHARKNWMRHTHRSKPSASILADRCIYPNINSF